MDANGQSQTNRLLVIFFVSLIIIMGSWAKPLTVRCWTLWNANTSIDVLLGISEGHLIVEYQQDVSRSHPNVSTPRFRIWLLESPERRSHEIPRILVFRAWNGNAAPTDIRFRIRASTPLLLLGIWILGSLLIQDAHRRKLDPDRCVVCGYDLTGLTRCPECGTVPSADTETHEAP